MEEKNDEKKQEEKPEEQPTEDTGDRDKPAEPDKIDRANEAAERLEQANKVTENLVKRQEKLAVEKALGGKGEAGTEPVKKEEETPKEYKDRVMSNDPTLKE